MRAVVLTRKGPPEVLRVEERPTPRPEPGELLIDLRAAGVGFSDLLKRVGLHPRAPDLPAVIGYEAAGVVSAIGPDGDEFAVGDRVAAFVPAGAYAEQVVARYGDVLRLPDELSFEQGAALPLSYATAYGALVRYGACRTGERILIHAAAGGVGSAATQLAKTLDLEVWGTASPRKHDAIRELGVDHPVDYTTNGWERPLPGLDLVMDALGGASFRRSYALLRPGGRLVCFGVSGVAKGERRNLLRAARTVLRTPRFNPMKQMQQSKTVIGLDTIALWEGKGSLAELLQPLAPLVSSGRLRPRVAARFPFAEAADAHRMLASGGNVGKVVLVP